MAEDIQELNRLLSSEYQRLGPLAWIRSDDPRLFHPFLVETEDQKPVYDSHTDETTGLVELTPQVDFAPLLPRFQGGETDPPIWVLCHQRFCSEAEWASVYHTKSNYTASQWVPTYTSYHDVVPIHLTETPNLTHTWGIIHFLRSLHIPSPGETTYNLLRKREQQERLIKQDNKYMYKHLLGAMGRVLHTKSGSKSSGVSYPSI